MRDARAAARRTPLRVLDVRVACGVWILTRGNYQGGNPFGSRGTTSSGVFDISTLRPATDLGLERREASAAPKKAQEGEGSEFLGAQPDGNPIFLLDTNNQLREGNPRP